MKEDKIERLLHAMDHPDEYSDQELQELFNDEETRQCYELMLMVEEGFHHSERKAPQSKLTIGSKLLKIAALFVAILMLSGITYAAYHFAIRGGAKSPVQVENTAAAANSTRSTINSQPPESDPVRTFENTELQQILQELSTFYHVSVEFRNEQSRHIRLYTKWDTSAPLATIIERLNRFEKVSVRLNNNQIIAE
jgi:hypothetical protein